MSRKLSLRSLFGTLLFVFITVIIVIILYISKTKPNQPLFWFLGVLFIGMFLCVMTCISNINSTIKIQDKHIQEKDLNIMFHTCPEYWTKRIVQDNNNQNVTMCHNNIGTNKFINGSFTSNVDNGFVNNQLSTSNLSDLRNLWTSNIEEGYTEYHNPGTNDGSLSVEEYNKKVSNYTSNLHEHNNLYLITEGDGVNQKNNNGYDIKHRHRYPQGRGFHSHDESGMDGEMGNGTFSQYGESYKPTNSNFDYWLNPYLVDEKNSKYSMEINLNKLNESKNKCTLAKRFPWVEANAKC
jgi:hypothetical protein